MRFDAILFDLDGTLVDSIPHWEQAYVHALNAHGLPVRLDDFLESYQKGQMRLDTYLEELGFTGDHDAVRTDRDREYIRLLETQLQWFDGAEDLLTELQAKNIPVAIVTGSHTAYTEAIDRRLDWRRFTEVCISIDDTQGVHKPDPTGLFMACSLLNVSPENCVYAGDQAGDRDAAKNANMRSCIIRTPYTPGRATECADITIDHVADLANHVE